MHIDPGQTPPPDPLRRFDSEPSSHGRLLGLGFQFAGAIVLCVLAGQWLDRRFGTDPWGVLVGALVGFAAGFYSIFRTAMGTQDSEGAGKPGAGKGKRTPSDGGTP